MEWGIRRLMAKKSPFSFSSCPRSITADSGSHSDTPPLSPPNLKNPPPATHLSAAPPNHRFFSSPLTVAPLSPFILPVCETVCRVSLLRFLALSLSPPLRYKDVSQTVEEKGLVLIWPSRISVAKIWLAIEENSCLLLDLIARDSRTVGNIRLYCSGPRKILAGHTAAGGEGSKDFQRFF